MLRTCTLAIMSIALMLAALPVTAGATPHKRLDARGSVPARWDLGKPAAAPHVDQAPTSAGGTGDGRNTISFGAFDDGDLIVVLGTGAGHAGVWDDAYHYSDSSLCVLSANVTPTNNVLREQPIKYRLYDEAYGLWVPAVTSTARAKARSYARAQLGETYNISSSKSDQSAWYCSKLGWAAYRFTASIDLDADGGYWVWPIDLVNDAQTYVFARSS